MKLARVFPSVTSLTPRDQHAYYGPPDLFTPEYDEIHISVTFTWDLPHADFLYKQWKYIAPTKIGGPAIDGEGSEFIPGVYIALGSTITSRGCPNKCPFCFVKKSLTELKAIHPGNNILDNNFLATSPAHQKKVFEMLRSQKAISFSGGLEVSRITPEIADILRTLSIKHLFLAYDRPAQLPHLKNAVQILHGVGFKDYQIRCYVLMGFNNDTPEKALQRLIVAYNLGTFPFAMLYRNKTGDFPEPYRAWRKLQHTWTRPAGFRAFMKNHNGTNILS